MRIDNPSISGSLSFLQGTNTISGTSVSLTGSLSGTFEGAFSGDSLTNISGAFDSVSASLASDISGNAASINSLNSASSSYLLNTTDTLDGDLTVTGKITAQEFHTEFVSASIIYESGSTQFGNSADDTHMFTGTVTGTKFNVSSSNQVVAVDNGNLRVWQRDAANLDFLTNDELKVRIDGSGNLQVGITSLSASGDPRVTVGSKGYYYPGSGNGLGDLHIGNGTYGLSIGTAIGGGGAGDTRIWTTGGTNRLFIGVGDSITIESGGNVGIGVTTPGAKLDVDGNIIAGGGNSIISGTGLFTTSTIQLHNGTAAANNIDRMADIVLANNTSYTDGILGRIIAVNSSLSSAEKRNAQISFNNDGATNSGKISFSTSYEGAFLDRVSIQANGILNEQMVTSYGSRTPNLRLSNSNIFGTNYTDGSFFNIVFGNELATNSHLGELAVVQENASASTASSMRFYTNSGGGNGALTEKLRITPSGNVGIGTTSPTQKLHVIGSIKSSANILAGSDIGLEKDGETFIFNNIRGTDSAALGGASYVALKTYTSGWQERLRIIQNGNVGIGTTSPIANLHVQDTDGAAIVYQGANRGKMLGKTIQRLTVSNPKTDLLTINSFQSANSNVFVVVDVMYIYPVGNSGPAGKAHASFFVDENNISSPTISSFTYIEQIGSLSFNLEWDSSNRILKFVPNALAYMFYTVDVEYITYDGATITFNTSHSASET